MFIPRLMGTLVLTAFFGVPAALAQCEWRLMFDEEQLQDLETNDLLAVPFAGQRLFASSAITLLSGLQPPFPAVRAWDGENLSTLPMPGDDFSYPAASRLAFFEGRVIAGGFFGDATEEGSARIVEAWGRHDVGVHAGFRGWRCAFAGGA